MSKYDFVEQELQAAKNELLKRQEDFLWFVQHEMDTSTFERNAINNLLVMSALREKIRILEKQQRRNGLDVCGQLPST